MKNFRKMLFLPSILLGMLFAIPGAAFFESIFGGLALDWIAIRYLAMFAVGIVTIYGFLTWFVFRVKESTFNLSPNQFRVIWIGAFVLGAVGTPLVVSTL